MESLKTFRFALLGIAFAACADEQRPPVTVAERDSAGVRIVENAIDTLALRTGWTISEQPELVIGGTNAAEADQLYQVNGARRLSDGRIAVANAGSSQIRIYSPDGMLLVAHGRKGEGPGEFTQPRLAGTIGGDSLVVFDPDLRRASIVHPDAGYVRSYPVGTEGGGYPLAQGVLRDGSLAIGGGMYFSSDQGFPSGAVRAPSRYLVIGPDGTMRGDLGERPAAEMFARASASQFSASVLPFGRVTGYSPGSDRVWIGTGDAWELMAYSAEGSLDRIVRFDRARAGITDALVSAYTREREADARDENEARTIRAQIAEMPMPDYVPPWELFTADALDHVWIGEFLLPGENARTWTIIDRDGRAVGRVTTPLRTLPLDIGEDYVLGVTRDDLEVESITLWRLGRPGRS